MTPAPTVEAELAGTTRNGRDNFAELVKAAKAAYDAMSPIDRAIHDLKQKRSGMIGLSDFDQPVERIKAHIDARPEFVVLAELERLRASKSAPEGDVRAAALEEAAKIADVEYDKVRIGDGEFGGGRANASRIIAGQIRAISKQSGTP